MLSAFEPKTDKCVICHQPIFLEDRGETQWLPCTHVYHKDCIQTWAETRNVTLELACPQCKNDKLEAPGFAVTEPGATSSSSQQLQQQPPISAGETFAIDEAFAAAAAIV